MMLDLKKLFPDTKFPTAEELKAKEDSFSIGDRVKVANNIRCIQHGQTGTIVQIEPEDKHGWKSFIVKFDNEKYGAMSFQSGNIDKINKRENTMKKSTLRKRLVKEHFPKKIELRDFIQNNIEDKHYDDLEMFVDAEFGFDLYHEDPYGLWSEEELNSWLSAWLKDREDPEGRGLMNENTKVTLTIGQLKKLVRESNGFAFDTPEGEVAHNIKADLIDIENIISNLKPQLNEIELGENEGLVDNGELEGIWEQLVEIEQKIVSAKEELSPIVSKVY